jgi:hypothetical protein
MAITQAICNSFKTELLTATHNFTLSTGHVFKIALYLSTSNISASTTAYGGGTATNETTNTAGTAYTAGGNTLTNVTPTLSGSTAVTSFNTPTTWTTSSLTARGALIYNSSASNKAVVALDFGADKTSSAGDFSIVFPAVDASNAIIRIV